MKEEEKKKSGKKNTIDLNIPHITVYTTNQGRVSCSLYSANIVVSISHIVEPYTATCVYDYPSCWSVGILWVFFVCKASLPSSVSLMSFPFRISWIFVLSLAFVTCPVFWSDLWKDYVYSNVQNTKCVLLFFFVFSTIRFSCLMHDMFFVWLVFFSDHSCTKFVLWRTCPHFQAFLCDSTGLNMSDNFIYD